MKTWLKWSLAGLLLLVAVPMLSVLFIDLDDYKQWISNAVEANTGRPLFIEGELKWTASVKPKISAETIRYPNAPWGKHQWAIEVDRVEFTVDLWALLHGHLLVEEIVLEKPTLRVEKNASGAYNFTLGRASERSVRVAVLPGWLDVSDAEIVDGEITVTTPGRDWEINIHQAHAVSEGRDHRIVVEFDGEVEQTPVTASVTLGSLETLYAFRPSPIFIDSRVGVETNRIHAGGSAGNLLKWYDVDLDLEFSVAQTSVLSALADATLLEVGPVNGRARFDQPRSISSMGLRKIELKSEKLGLDSTLSGEIDRVYDLTGVDLELAMAGPLDQILPRLSHLGPGTGTAELTREQGFWNLHNVELSLQRDTLNITGTGSVTRLNGGPSARLHFIAEAADGQYVQPLFEFPLPALAGLKMEADVAFDQDIWRATVNKLDGRMYGLELSAGGTVDNLNQWYGIDLAITGRADSLAELPRVAGKTPPRSGPVQMRTRLVDDESGELHLTGFTASTTDPILKLEAHGEIRNLGESMRTHLDWELELADAKLARPWLEYPEEVSGVMEMAMPVKATGTLHSRDADDWGIRDIGVVSLADGMDVVLSGEITKLDPTKGRIHLVFGGLAASRLSLPWEIPWSPDSVLNGSLDFVVEKGEVNVENIDAAIDSAGVTMALRGAIERFNPIETKRIELEFDAASVSDLEWPYTDSLNPDNPVSGSVTVATGAHSNHFEMHLNIGSSDLRGTLEWRFPVGSQTVPRVRADLVSDQLDLAEIQQPAAKKNRFFSPAPIDADWIHKLDGQIDLRAGQAGNTLISMSDVTVRTVLEQGTLRQTISGKMGQGELTSALTFDANSKPFPVEFSLSGERLDTAGLPASRKNNYLDSGSFDLDIDFSAEGLSVADLMANATGGVSLRLHEATIKNQSLDIFGGDIFSNLLTAINPFKEIGEYVYIECGIIQFDIAEGIARTTNSLAVKTDRVTILGGGEIDLRDESLDITLSPKARAGFGISAASLANIIQLGGTLAEPKIEADSNRLLQTGAALWAAIYSGGWTVLAQGLLNRTKANSDVCDLLVDAEIEQSQAERRDLNGETSKGK